MRCGLDIEQDVGWTFEIKFNRKILGSSGRQLSDFKLLKFKEIGIREIKYRKRELRGQKTGQGDNKILSR